MPFLRINDCTYYYELHGDGPETMVFAHGLLWSGKMFHKQVEHFKDRYRILIYDHRGQGRSEVTESGYDMDQLYQDLLSLIQKLELGPVHLVGLSMGGFVSMRLAARNPDLVKSLVLLETSAEPETKTLKYKLLVVLVQLFGVRVVTGSVMQIMFGQKFLNDPRRQDEKKFWIKEYQKNPKSVIRAVRGVIKREGIEHELPRIKCPVLILVGTDDRATPPKRAEVMHNFIPQSEFVKISGAGHTSCIEEPKAVHSAMDKFLVTLNSPKDRNA